MLSRWLRLRERARADAALHQKLEQQFHACARAPLDDAPLRELAELVPLPDWREQILAGIELMNIYRRESLPPESEYQDLRNRIHQLYQRYDTSHDAAVMPWLRELYCVRGIVEGGRLSVMDFFQHGERLFEIRPVIHLTIDNLGDSFDRLLRSPLLSRLRGLHLHRARVDDAKLSRLVCSPQLNGLRVLDLRHNEITKVGVEALVRAKGMPHLRKVRLANNPCGKVCAEWTFEQDWGQLPPDPSVWDVEVPRLGRELEEQFGRRRWISDPPRDKTGGGDWIYYLLD